MIQVRLYKDAKFREKPRVGNVGDMCVNYLLKTIYFIYILNILLSIYFFYIIYCLEYINLTTIIDNKVNSWPLNDV